MWAIADVRARRSIGQFGLKAVIRSVVSATTVKAIFIKLTGGSIGFAAIPASPAQSALYSLGVLAIMINSVTEGGIYSYLAAGFILGSAGEVAVKALQDRFFKIK